jgi:hypothetical protein
MKAKIINMEYPVRYDAVINQITSTPPRTIRTKSSRTRYHTITAVAGMRLSFPKECPRALSQEKYEKLLKGGNFDERD